MSYELYYWPSIQGRGEFIRLALAEANAEYRDIAREDSPHGGVNALLRAMDDASAPNAPFAPPFLKSGRLVIAQTANILLYLGERHNLAPKSDAGRIWTHQLQLTLADLVQEVHDTHHPISAGLYYADQHKEARRRTADFLATRMPKYLGYFEKVLSANQSRGDHVVGARLSYVDLSLFQLVEGLRYAFPRTMRRQENGLPRVAAVHDMVAARPRIARYLASEARIPFNEDGLFRHYPELDA